MMSSVVATAVALIAQIMPYVTGASAAVGTVGKVIALMESIVPPLIQEGRDLIPTVKNIISTLRGASTATKEQLDQLDAIEAKIDAGFDAAAGAAETEDQQ